MVISMAVLLIPIALIVWFFQTVPDENVERLDVEPVIEVADEALPYPVLRPINLPDEWVPVRVNWAEEGERWIDGEPATGNSWQLGYLSPDELYVGLQQRDQAIPSFLTSVTREGQSSGETVTVDGREWERWTSSDGRTHSLVWQDDDVTAVVTSDDDPDLVLAFVGALSDGTE